MKRKTIKRGVNLLPAAEEGKKQSILERKTHMEVSTVGESVSKDTVCRKVCKRPAVFKVS